MTSEDQQDLGLGLKPGDHHYRAYVGPPEDYDLIAAMTFNLLTTLGLRQHHSLLDIGCGSLRIGRLLIPYLNRGKYFGMEPNEWLVEEGINHEIGKSLVEIKHPTFFFSDSPGIITQANVAFDFALAQSIFSHCELNLIKNWLAAISPSLARDGPLVQRTTSHLEYRTGKSAQRKASAVIDENIFATPRKVKDVADCYFYHTMELPGHGVIEGRDWDLRGRVDGYFGNVEFAGRRIL